MVDLQRCISRIWKTVPARFQAGWKNSDAGASQGRVFRRKFSGPDSGENFIRADLS
jgi:hypothetical protein